jgi:transcriptional regulator with XRE-family HTH domain
MSQEQNHLLPPSVSENIRHNLWIYRTYQNQTRKELADANLRSGVLRAYEYGFRPVSPAHLALIAERLAVPEEVLSRRPISRCCSTGKRGASWNITAR